MAPGVAKTRAKQPIIATVDEYDQLSARRRQAPKSATECTDTQQILQAGNASNLSISKEKKEKRGSAILLQAKRVFKGIMSDAESRSIFMFLLINLSYMVVQVAYGYITNSLGLISDAIHMLFDCMALAIGLVAAVISKWPPSKSFVFGYGRIETLSGFANGVFLMLISISIFFEAIERLLHPPEMNTQKLLLVSFGGLVVNLFGMFAFNAHHHHGHSHGTCSHGHGHSNSHNNSHDHDHNHDHHSHSHGHSHNHNHNHNHDDHSHDHHSHDHHGHNHSHHQRSQNMEGVFLHVLADTLGSVGVIVSTLLIQWFGWTGFDPLASIMIAGLIFASVIPLVRDSMYMLLLRLPDHTQIEVENAVDQIVTSIEEVSALTKVQFWPVTDTHIIGIIHAKVHQSSKDEKSMCLISLREHVCSAIDGIIRANVSELKDVFVHVDICE